jgi:hypothetical protein
VAGASVLAAIERSVPPGRASRLAVGALRTQQLKYRKPQDEGKALAVQWTLDHPSEAIRLGKQYRARRAMESRVRDGTWETKPDVITAAHYRGEDQFVVRNPHTLRSGLTLAAVADQLGTTRHILRSWIDNGVVPNPVNENGLMVVPFDQIEIYQTVFKHYKRSGRRWRQDAIDAWRNPFVCPQCGYRP